MTPTFESHSGFRCLDCQHEFHEDDADFASTSEMVDDMNDRPSLRLELEDVACPECGCSDLRTIEFCHRCSLKEAQAGADHCARCITIIDAQGRERDHRAALQAASPLRDWDLATVVNELVDHA